MQVKTKPQASQNKTIGKLKQNHRQVKTKPQASSKQNHRQVKTESQAN